MKNNITEKYKKRTRLRMKFRDIIYGSFDKGVNEFKTEQVPFWEIGSKIKDVEDFISSISGELDHPCRF